MTYNRLDIIWDEIVLYGIATEEELQLITAINGYNEKTLNDVIFARTGYRNIGQFCENDLEGVDLWWELEEAEV